MAIYELSTMRLPFAGPLRLRPTGVHATSKNTGGSIYVLVDVMPKETEKKEEEKEA